MDALEDYASETADRLPRVEDDDLVTLRADDLPSLPAEVVARELIAEASWQIPSPGCPVRRIIFWGTRRAYRRLGLMVLSQVLHQGPRTVTIRFAPRRLLDTDPASPIAKRHIPEVLVLELPVELESGEDREGLRLKADSFVYGVEARERKPFRDRWTGASGLSVLPGAHLTDAHGFGVAPEEPPVAIRGFAGGFGSLEGAVGMAKLLLDISQESAGCPEYDLETEIGTRGVAPGSAEIRLVLPGAFSWLPRGLGETD